MFHKFTIFVTAFLAVQAYRLKQVVVLSRHNIRTPLHYNIAKEFTPNTWPTWNLDYGSLTPKGSRLEQHMGKYFYDWMIKEQLLDSDCPGDQVFVYANTNARAKDTAKAFTKGAFRNCVEVHFKNITDHDPIFQFNARNASKEFKDAVINEVEKKLNSTSLTHAFKELNRIVNFGNSTYCKTENVCDLSEAKTEVVFNENIAQIFGGVRIGWILVDSFLMAYYDGMSNENIAWGKIQTEKQWEMLMTILNTYHKLHFETKILDKKIVLPLLEYLLDIFQDAQDANISVLMTALDFKEYVLVDQLEKTPIGGKLVFEKWYDERSGRDLLKVNYVYQSTKQIRDGVEASSQNPPLWQIMEMEQCTVDEDGFCPWADFVNLLKNKVLTKTDISENFWSQ